MKLDDVRWRPFCLLIIDLMAAPTAVKRITSRSRLVARKLIIFTQYKVCTLRWCLLYEIHSPLAISRKLWMLRTG